MLDETAASQIPRALESYPSSADGTLAADLAMRVQIEPFNGLATAVFLLAILHTFAAARFAALAIACSTGPRKRHARTAGRGRRDRAVPSRIELKTPLLAGFFLAGLVIHGGLQGWWIAPVLGRLPETPLFFGATALTAVNDHALITCLATLVRNLGDELKLAVVQGAVVGGGLTVIANAPNPAGQALLSRFFDGAISPLGLLAGALVPTMIAALVFRLL